MIRQASVSSMRWLAFSLYPVNHDKMRRSFINRAGKSLTKDASCIKYRNKKTVIDGIKFDSQLEARCYKPLKDSGLEFTRQEPFEIQKSFKDGEKTIRAMTYRADFVVTHNGIRYVLDAKGMQTPEFKIKYKLLLFQGIRIICVSSMKRMGEACIYIKQGMTPMELERVLNPPKKRAKASKSP